MRLGLFVLAATAASLCHCATPDDPEPMRDDSEATARDLDQATVQRHVRRNLDGIKDCYAARLEEVASLSGTITLRFTIAPEGSVGDVGFAADTLGDAALRDCAARDIAAWRFPPSDGSIEVTYPLVLRRQ